MYMRRARDTIRKRKRVISFAHGYVNALCDLFEFTASNEIRRFDIGRVGESVSAMVERYLKIKVFDFSYEIDNYAIRHALSKHGQDELPLMYDDIGKIPRILRCYDELAIGGLTKQGNASLVFKMVDGSVLYLFVAEIRTKHGTISMKTMYKQKHPSLCPMP